MLTIATSAYAAIVFRTKQSLCYGTEQIILYSSGKYVIYDDSVEAYSGSYTIDSSDHVIILDVEGKSLRCKYYLKKDGLNISYMTFRGNNYYPCSR